MGTPDGRNRSSGRTGRQLACISSGHDDTRRSLAEYMLGDYVVDVTALGAINNKKPGFSCSATLLALATGEVLDSLRTACWTLGFDFRQV